MTEKYLFFRTLENEGAVRALRDLEYIATAGDGPENDDLIFVFKNSSGTGEDQVTIELKNNSDKVEALLEFAAAVNKPHSDGWIVVADDHKQEYVFSRALRMGASVGSFG
tara:strand:- start:656 stop:985 length:330 start_codon:yes stop_codon:yes gene_type:complete